VNTPPAICGGGSATLTATPSTGGGTYSWSPGGATAQVISVSPGSTTTYTVTYTLSGCSATGTSVVTVNTAPTVSISPASSTICSGQSSTLTATPSVGGGSYSWAPGGATTTSITVSPGTTTTYTVTYTLSGCSGTATRTITVNSTPTVSVNTPAAICAGSSASLTATPSAGGGTYSWAPGGATTQTISVSPVSTTTYTVTYTLAGCSGTGTRTVTVNTVPTVSISPATSTICAGQSSTLTATPSAGGGTYSWAPGGATTAAITVSPAGTTTYTVTYTLAGCVGTNTRTITVNPTPTVTVNTPAAICSGASTTLTATPSAGGGTYLWNPGGGVTQSVSVSPGSSATYTVTYTLAGCSGTGTSLVTVNPTPTVSISPASSTICAGQSATLTATPSAGGGTYSWTPGGAATSAITVSPAGTTTYTVTYTLAGCVGTATRTITVNPMDNANFNYGGSTTFCQTGTNPNAVITGLPGGTFTSSPGGLSINASTGTINLAGSALNTYNVTYTTNGACPNTFTLPVTITSAPSANFSFGGPYCQSAANPLPTFGAGASAGTFSATPAGLVFVNVNTGQINVSASTPGTYSVTNSIAAGGGCSAATFTFPGLTINPSPVITATPASQTICSGTATGIALSSSIGGTTYSWTVTQTGVSGASAGSGSNIAQTLSTTGAVAGTATYTVTSTAGGCAGNTLTVTITVNPVPTATPSPVAQTICSGNTTSISLTGSLPGTTFAWAAPTQTGATGGTAGTGSSIVQTLTATGAGAGTVTYNIVPTANSCPGASVPVIITVNPAPVVTATPASPTICSGSATSVNLTSTVAGTTFSWIASNGAGVSGAAAGSGSSINQTLTNSSAGSGVATYTVTPSASGCPGATITVTVTVNPIPTVTPSPSSQTICSGSVTGISLTGTIPGTTFAWGAPTQTAASGGSAGSGTTIAQTLLASGASAGTVTYNIVPTANGCTGPSVPVVITVNPVPFVTATPASATICSGATTAINLSSFTAGTTFTWTAVNGAGISGAAAGSGSSIAQTLTNSTSSTGTATYTITPSASGCPGSPINVVITVNPVPNVTATPPGQSICSGNTTAISLTSTVPGTTFSWAAPTQTGASGGAAGSGSSITQTLTATGASAGTVTYNIVPTANSCPGAPLAVSVTINPNPVGTATPASASICSGTSTSVALSSSIPGTTYSWTTSSSGATGGSAGSGSTISQVLTASGTTAGTVTYNVTATSPAGCTSVMAPIVITVNPTPNVSATPSSATICSGTATGIVLTSNVAGTTFTWTVTQSGVSGAVAGSGSTITQTLTATGTTPGSAVYTITPSASGCASGSPVTVTITVNPLPVVTATPATQTICNGGVTGINFTSNLGATTFNWTVTQTNVTGAAAGSGTSIAQVLNLVTSTIAGSAVYSVTPTDNGCAGSPVSVTVNVNPIDNAAFSYSSSTYCITGTDPSPTVTGASGGVFTASPAGLVLDSLTGLIDLSTSALGSYSITYQTNGPCPSNSIVSVTITNAPSALFLYSSVCSSDPNPFPSFGPGASAGTFTASPAGIVFIDPATGEIDLANSTPGIYVITNSIAAGGGCAAASATDSITISQAATVDAGINDTICELETFTATGTMGGSAGFVTWSTNGTGSFDNTAFLSSVYTPSAADIAAGTVVLTVTTDDPAGGCVAVTDFVVLSITPLDSAGFSYTGSTFCASGTDPIPTVTGVAGGMFTSSPAGLVFVNAATGEIDLSASVIGTYDIVYSTNGPCPSADTVTIILTNAPVATFTFAGTATSFCQSDANPTPVFGSGASAGTFTATPTGLTFVNPATGEVDLANSSPGTYTIYNNIVAAGGCAAALDSLAITINQPATVNAGNDTTVCAGATYTVSGANIGGSAANSTWTTSGSGTFDNATLLNPTYTPSAADTAAGTVTLYLTTDDPAGVCNAVTDSLILTITPLPQAPVVTNPAPYCAGSTVGPISYTGFGGTVNWYSDAGLTVNIGTGNPFTPTGITGTTSIWVTETGACTSFASQVDITFNPLPVADSSNVVVTGATCGNATGSITGVTMVSGQNPFTYLWQDSLGNNVGDSLNLTNVGPGVYTLTITDGNGCVTTISGGSTLTVTSTSGVVASFTTDPATGEKPLLVNFTNTSTGGVTYLWEFPNGNTSTSVDASFIFTQLGTNSVCLIADNGSGCADTACTTIDVFINSTFIIPNVFTPNGDEVNDIFTVKNVGLETMDAEIYNRWGQKQYEWHTTNGGWDGRTAAGVLVPDGTYFFIMSAKGFDGKEYFEKGSFELIR
jgi:gliding motility-associated-like protein